jgi:hypothetical protein
MFATMGIGLLVAKEHPDWRNVLYTVGALAIAIPVVGWVGRALAIRVRGKP